MPQDAQDLKVWQRAIDLTVCVYQLTQRFPREETYGLVSQLRRASVSIASNIAEGRGRLNPAEFRQFLGIALGSTFEIKTQLIVARRLGMGSAEAMTRQQPLVKRFQRCLPRLFKNLAQRRDVKAES